MSESQPNAGKWKAVMAVGGSIATGAAGLAAIGGPIGIVAGIVVGAIGAGITAYGAYKLEPPREVWTEEKRRRFRQDQKQAAAIEAYDDEVPGEPKR